MQGKITITFNGDSKRFAGILLDVTGFQRRVESLGGSWKLELDAMKENVKRSRGSGQNLDVSLGSLGLSARTYNSLEKEGNIRFVGELLEKTPRELFVLRNFGNTSLAEVFQTVRKAGLQFTHQGAWDSECLGL